MGERAGFTLQLPVVLLQKSKISFVVVVGHVRTKSQMVLLSRKNSTLISVSRALFACRDCRLGLIHTPRCSRLISFGILTIHWCDFRNNNETLAT